MQPRRRSRHLGTAEGQRPLPVAERVDPTHETREETAVEGLETADQRSCSRLRRATHRRRGVQSGGDGQRVGCIRFERPLDRGVEMPERRRRGQAGLAVDDEVRAERRHRVGDCLGDQAVLALLLDGVEQLPGDLPVASPIPRSAGGPGQRVAEHLPPPAPDDEFRRGADQVRGASGQRHEKHERSRFLGVEAPREQTRIDRRVRFHQQGSRQHHLLDLARVDRRERALHRGLVLDRQRVGYERGDRPAGLRRDRRRGTAPPGSPARAGE